MDVSRRNKVLMHMSRLRGDITIATEKSVTVMRGGKAEIAIHKIRIFNSSL